MSVESVDNNSNAGLYSFGAAVAGAGAGAGTAYLTKPYLKDGAPTDTFTKKIYEKLKEEFPEQSKRIEADKKSIEDAKTVEELKNVFVKSNGNIEVSQLKNETILDFFKSVGIKQEYIEQLKKVNTIEEAEAIFGQMFDKEYAEKNIDEIKNAMKETVNKAEKQAGKILFDTCWDKDKKEFKNCENGLGKKIKGIAKSIQNKYALIYGCIGAAILGITTYLIASGKKPEQASADKFETSV